MYGKSTTIKVNTFGHDVQVKSVKIKPIKNTSNGCGIDGELFPVNGQVISSLLPEQCRLIGRPPTQRI